MAVWLMVWGRNYCENFEEVEKMLGEKPVDIPLDLNFLSNSNNVNQVNEKVQLNSRYDKKFWKLIKSDQALNLVYQLPSSEAKSDNDVGWYFGLMFYKDIISFRGPFNHFSKWYLICEDKDLAKGWSQVIRSIYTYLGAKEIIYFTEWGFGYEDAMSYSEIDEWIKSNSVNKVDDLMKLVESEKFYVESLS